ncbi:MAG: T9SS type A sorting domain-containing protein [Bacteroidia bacterium]|nr:T9SS type A sorting domain-containing protein [Bacteroidia bacterium]
MKKLLLSATAFLFVMTSGYAQDVKPCGTYQARENHLKNVPGYAAKLNAAEALSNAEYQAFLQNRSSFAKVNSTNTYTIPVVFHVLHLGQPVGTGINISDATCQQALDYVNRDYQRKNADTIGIDPLFDSLYINSRFHFQLAKKDPNGNCTNGVIHHYDENTNWAQSNLLAFKYSTYAPGNWNPSKYLNIYIVKNIIDDGGNPTPGQIIGYTYIPGTSPVSAADAIVYRYDNLFFPATRSLSHEIGHWLGLSHTFGSSNNAGVDCGNDDIADTPPTTGFFSTCPKAALFPTAPTVLNPTDSSDIVAVSFGSTSATINYAATLVSNSSLNSAVGTFSVPTVTKTGTTTVNSYDTRTLTANGVVGGYSDFTSLYANDFVSGASNRISITSVASASVNNYVALYIDKNRDGDFIDGGETIFVSSANLLGTQTFTSSTTLTGTGLMRMRVITSSSPITSPTATINSGEFEDYILNVGLISCFDYSRPNIENIMDYSACPKMFTKKQTAKMRLSAESSVAGRNNLHTIANLQFTGILDGNGNPTGPTPCAPIADFSANKNVSCEDQSIVFTNTSYNGTPTSFNWEFEGGTPSTSTLSTQSVTYADPGVYSVTLTVSNADGSSSKVSSNYVTAAWNSYMKLPYSEDFESGQWWPTGWVVDNEDSGTPSWELSQYGAPSATLPGGSLHSMVLASANYPQGFPGFAANADAIETPAFDFTGTTGISLSYDYSFARKTGVAQDTFKVQYTTDCGGTWKVLPGHGTTITNSMAVSGGTVNAPYIPWSSTVPNPKWKTKVVSAAAMGSVLNNQRNVKFRFWFQNDIVNGQSQNLYIDNINITGIVSVNEFETSLGLSIYPNPTSSSSVVEYTSPIDSKVNILVYDVTGRVVEENNSDVISGVSSSYTVNASGKLNSGIYFITLNIGNNKITKKLVIN